MGNNIGYRSIVCQQSFLDKYNNGSLWRNPALVPKPKDRDVTNMTLVEIISMFVNDYTYVEKTLTAGIDAISFILIIFLLIINQKKKVVDGYGLRLFTNNLLGILFYRLTSRMILSLYEIIWNISKYRMGYCAEKYHINNGTFIETVFVFDPDDLNMGHSFITLKVFDFQIYSFLYANNEISKNPLPCITILQLFLHRTTICAAVSYPRIYQEFFTEKLLRFHYVLIWLIFLTYQYGLYFQDSELYLRPYSTLMLIFAIIHLIISVLSLFAVCKYQHTKQKEMNELKAFTAFSVYPVLITIFEQLYGYGNSILLKHVPTIHYVGIFIFVLDVLNPLYMLIIFFIFIKQYRKATAKLLCFWKSKRKNSVLNIQHISVSRSF